MKLSEDVISKIGDAAGVEIFKASLEESLAYGDAESVAFIRAWNDLVFKGYEPDAAGVFRRRSLVRHDQKTSKVPFPVDSEIMGKLRPDQVPRFLGALTNPELLEEKEVFFSDLTAIQNRVSTEKIDSLLSETDFSKPAGVVAKIGVDLYILDGHHRIVARWLSGAEMVSVHFINLSPLSNAMKSKQQPDFTFSQNVNKLNTELRVVYGWANVIEEDGQTVIDYQKHTISPAELTNAAHKFISSSRTAKVMHEGEAIGEIVESMVFTPDIQKALGIDLNKVGWWIGLKVFDDKVWEAVKEGRLKMFSIGGRGKIIDRV